MKTMYIEDKKEKGKRIKKKLLHISLKKNISPLHSGQKNITLLNNISFLNTTSSLFLPNFITQVCLIQIVFL